MQDSIYSIKPTQSRYRYPRPVIDGLLFVKQGHGVLLCDDNIKYEGEFVGECLLSGKVLM